MTTPITTDELTYDTAGNPELDYHALNAQLNIVGPDGGLQLDSDKEAARQFFLQHVNGNTWFFHDLEEKIEYLVDNGYYEEEVIEQYSWKFVKDLYKRSYQYKYRFETFLGAFKYYTSYTLKTFDGKRYLERFEDRVVMVALYLGHGNEEEARNILDEMMSGRYQPATPTFLNAGKKQRGELVSCFPAGTPVDTLNGTTKIEDIKEGDLVLSHDGKFHRVEKLLINRNSSPLVSIRHYGTKEPLVSTENHPILVWTDRDIETLIEGDGADPKNGFVWIEAQDVESGDYVVASFPTEIHEQRTFDVGLRGGKKNLKNSDFYKFIDGRLVFEVKNVEVLEDGIPETVYNLEVEDTHTYSVHGTVVHNCYLTRIEDNMESISRSITTALQLSKRGGGVALLLTNLRESGAPIKHIENQSSGVVPVMKLLEDSFSYANQLGARQGAGAVYLNVHHPDIMRFLDTKRENADEKVRIKTLSLGVVIPDITFELAKRNEDMYLFSPYDVERVYNKPMSDISITEHYYEMVDNPRIRKSKINARTLFQTIAEIQFESGYPYILFEDTANRDNPIKGRINMSNLCLTGDTRLLTDKGYIRFDDLHASQDDFKVVSDNRSVEEDFEKSSVSLKNSTKAFLTKHQADTFKVSTKEGFEVKATEWHKFFIEEDGEILTKHLSELEIGDHLLVQPEEGAFGTIHNPESAEEAGRSLEGTVSRVLERRGQFVVRSSQTGKNFQFSKISQDTLSVPDFVWKGDRETVLSYLAGVFQVKSDVILNPDDSGIIIELGSSEKKFLQEIQQILLNLGVYSTISVNNDEKITDLFGQYADLVLRIIPGLVSNEDIENLSETLSQNGYNVENLMKMQEGFHKFRATVSSIDFHSVEDVYDVTVPDGHSIIVDGLSTSNCSEILQVNTPSEFNEDGTYRTVGKDISCNLGSLNIARTFDSPDFEKTIESSVRALTTVSDLSNVRSVPTIESGNKKSHAIGLGQMNLHGFLAREHIFYDSPEAVDFTNIYFYSTLYQVLRASNKIARERNETFDGFTESKYYTGEFFTKYIEKDWSHPETEKVRELFKRSNIYIPVPEDWIKLRESVHEYGIYNQNLQAIPPTGSISYINHSTSSIHPIAAPIEIRKEGKLGRVYYPVPFLSDDTLPYYKDAFGIGPKAIIDVYAAAQQHVDQSLSLTLFYLDTATTRDMNRNYVYAFSKGIKTLYYARIRQMALEGTQVEGTATEYCESCQL